MKNGLATSPTRSARREDRLATSRNYATMPQTCHGTSKDNHASMQSSRASPPSSVSSSMRIRAKAHVSSSALAKCRGPLQNGLATLQRSSSSVQRSDPSLQACLWSSKNEHACTNDCIASSLRKHGKSPLRFVEVDQLRRKLPRLRCELPRLRCTRDGQTWEVAMTVRRCRHAALHDRMLALQAAVLAIECPRLALQARRTALQAR